MTIFCINVKNTLLFERKKVIFGGVKVICDSMGTHFFMVEWNGLR